MNFQLINEKLLEVALQNDEVFAKRGSMIATTGEIQFSPAALGNGGLQDAAMRGVTNENLNLMRAGGRGTVLYGQNGLHVNLVQLNQETLYIESKSVLCFDSRLRTGTYFQGNSGGVGGIVRGAATGQGLWTTTLEGMGQVAILSEGEVIALDVNASTSVFVDPNAYVGHKGNVQSAIHTDVNWKTFVGQGSGESFQLKFSGQGTVYVQPSER
ncbi:AIM24 family protein [bacterium]|nr:MAG: AIM24 family protein [bacterium]